MTTNENLRLIYQRAMHLLQAGRIVEAIDAHEELLKIRPDLTDSWYNLGYLQQRARRYEEALVSYRQAVERGVACPEEIHLNCAVILAEHLGKMDGALVEVDLALTLRPGYVPALVNLGNIYEQLGERDQALGAYEKALAYEPANALALARLPNLRNTSNLNDDLILRLETAMARPGISAVEMADLGFGLGKALDSAGEYDRAFAAYCAANQASQLSAGEVGIKYDAAAHERYVDRLITAFPEPAVPRASTLAGSSPLFICGMFRSGSSLVEQILACHPDVTPGGEIDILPALASQYLDPILRESTDSIDGGKLIHLKDIYIDAVSKRFPDAAMVTDKRPDNFLNIGLIKLLFPGAKIIHTHRDPIDNCLSVFFLHLSYSMPYAFDLCDIAHWYAQYQRLMGHWKSLYGADIHDVYYDELVTNFEPAVTKLLNYCELPWNNACLEFHKSKTIVKTPSAWQVRQPLYKSSSGRWRNYQRHLDGLIRDIDRLLI